MKDWKILAIIGLVFAAAFWLPIESGRFQSGIFEGLSLLREYARQHVLLCLIPAFFIAGAISVFIRKEAVIKYFGARAKKVLSYGIASISGSILAVCSCTVLPLFAGIYTRGAGIGPASTFLYSGPAINVLAIILTAKVLGLKLGLARGIGAVVFAIVIGLFMHIIFAKDEMRRSPSTEAGSGGSGDSGNPLWKNAVFFFAMVGFLVAANWKGIGWEKWITAVAFLAAVLFFAWKWFSSAERREWGESSWVFAKQILPLLFVGVLAAGFLLGRPGHEAVIPSRWISDLVGGSSIGATLFASIAGALMYFATLTEVPILEGLLGAGMGSGPALALLLAGPALSLPNMLVIRSIIGTKKTMVYILLVVVMSTAAGLIYGHFIA